MKKILIKLTIFSLIISILVGLWALYIEPNQLQINKVTLKIPGWHKEHNNLKIAVLADLHTGSPFITIKKLKEIVKMTNKEKPDLILLLGDYVIQGVKGGKFIEPEKTAQELKNLNSKYGTIAILGNHDWWYDGIKTTKALSDAGITVLENNIIQIKANNETFYIAGLADIDTRPYDLPKLIKQIPENETVILLSHNPDIFPEVPDRINLTLSGHTHGGQVRLPIKGSVLSSSKYGEKYAKGHKVENGKHLFVSSGIGTSILPFRLLNFPEIAILTLEREG